MSDIAPIDMKNHQNNIIRTKNITKCLLLEVQNDYTKNWYVKTTKIFVCQSVLSQPLWQIQPSRGQNGLQACTMGSNSLKYEGEGYTIFFHYQYWYVILF